MAGRVVLFLRSASFEPSYQAASLGLTATAMGDEVVFVVAFDALRALTRGSLGQPETERERGEATRAEGLGAPSPSKMLVEARALGAKVYACDTTVRLCGLSEGDVGARLDGVLGLASIWRLTEGARVLSF